MKKAAFILTVIIICSTAVLILAGNRDKNLPQLEGKPAADIKFDSSKTKTVSIENSNDTLSSHKVIVYYLHGTRRCSNCIKIESYTKETIDSSLAEFIKTGLLEWRVYNTDEDSNAHFIKDYQLYTKSVIVSDVHNNKETRWKNLEKIWELLDDKAAFKKYIQDEVAAFLKEE